MTGEGIALLQPLSWLYQGGLAIARARRAGKPANARPRVVSVGNVTVGGSGKTPMALWLVARALAAGKSVAYASRGFAGAAGRGPAVTWVPCERAGAPSSFAGLRVVGRSADLAETVGDEAAMVARRAPGANMLVAGDKRHAIAAAAAMAIDVVVVDDAFQTFGLARHVDVVMLDARRPLGNGRLLPAGPLREAPSALARADVVVFNGASDRAAIAQAREVIGRWLRPEQRAYGLRRGITLLAATPAAREQPRDAVLVAGIARPDDFRESLLAMGVDASDVLTFRDHYRYRDLDARRIRERAGTRAIVTTEKDWVKLARFDWEGTPLWVARLDVELVGGNDVDAWLLP
jgi:tetraacyldisaccharide 4'-kinase